jgi:hypothetical protein
MARGFYPNVPSHGYPIKLVNFYPANPVQGLTGSPRLPLVLTWSPAAVDACMARTATAGGVPPSVKYVADPTGGPGAGEQAFGRVHEDGQPRGLEDRQVGPFIAHVVKRAATHHLTDGGELDGPRLVARAVTGDHHLKQPQVPGHRVRDPARRGRGQDEPPPPARSARRNARTCGR